MFTFFVPATPTSALYPLSLHDALPILPVLPGVAREPPLAGLRLGRRRVVAERRRYDRSRAREQALRMARRLGLRHRPEERRVGKPGRTRGPAEPHPHARTRHPQPRVRP